MGHTGWCLTNVIYVSSRIVKIQKRDFKIYMERTAVVSKLIKSTCSSNFWLSQVSIFHLNQSVWITLMICTRINHCPFLLRGFLHHQNHLRWWYVFYFFLSPTSVSIDKTKVWLCSIYRNFHNTQRRGMQYLVI